MRDVYGESFYLFGIKSNEEERIDYLAEKMSKEEAKKLIKRDYYDSPKKAYGQKVRDTFVMADFMVNGSSIPNNFIRRIIKLIFGHPYIYPDRDEYAINLAFSVALKSADLSRQVGAVIVSPQGDIVSTGINEVPKFGGGQYDNISDRENGRDQQLGYDPNKKQIMKIKNEIVTEFSNKASNIDADLIEKILTSSSLNDLTEFGRVVHAEMEAILSAQRNGKTVVGSTLYCTTFPCHNCAKHIIAAGIIDVIFIEPYDKSKALELHSDSISHEKAIQDKVNFRSFYGVAPYRFAQFFSMLTRKKEKSNEIVSETDWKPRLRFSRPLNVIQTMEEYIVRNVKTKNLSEEQVLKRKSQAKNKVISLKDDGQNKHSKGEGK